jgi:hypothetical protein
MEKEIINFSKFFESGSKPKLSDFRKEDFYEIVNEEEKSEKDKVEVEEVFDPPVNIEDFVEDDEEIEETDFEDSLPTYSNKQSFTKVKELKEEKEEEITEDYYPVYKDKSETFSCDVSVEGAKISETQARLILESDDWTLMFDGEIDRTGKCNIPIKKLNIFEEGVVGKIRLEVIAENTIFIPWEDDFKVKMSKRVSVQFGQSQKKSSNLIKESNVKVKVRR